MKNRKLKHKKRIRFWQEELLVIVILLVAFAFLFQMAKSNVTLQTSIATQDFVNGVSVSASQWYRDEDMTQQDVEKFMSQVMGYNPGAPVSFGAKFYDRNDNLIYQSAERNITLKCTTNGSMDVTGLVEDVEFNLYDYLSEGDMEDVERLLAAGTLGNLSYMAGFLEENGEFTPVKIVFQSRYDETATSSYEQLDDSYLQGGNTTFEWIDQENWNLLEEQYEGKTITEDGCGEIFLIDLGSTLDPLSSQLYKTVEFQRVNGYLTVYSTDPETNQAAMEELDEWYQMQTSEIHKSWASEREFSIEDTLCGTDRALIQVQGGGVYGMIVILYPINKIALTTTNLPIYIAWLSICVHIVLLFWRRMRKKQDQLDHMRNTFMNAMAHEMKTPAAVIKNSSECILESVNPEKNQHYLEMISRETDHMNDLLSKMLIYTRTMDSVYQLRKEPLDIPEMTRNAVDAYQFLMTERELTVEIQDLGMDRTLGDPDLIKMVIDNYISNAVRYATAGSQIRITLEKRQFTIYNECEELTREQMSRIWEPMYVIDESRTKTDGSAGMGLAICKNILELHGAEYRVENVEGGVRFSFKI